jgi:hypothetical protein
MAPSKKAPSRRSTKKAIPGKKDLMPLRPTDKPGKKQLMPLKPTDKPGVKVNMSKSTKKPKVEGPSNYTKNAIYKLPMTPAQSRKFNELYSSPKFKDTLFTIPKGTENLSQKEKDQMQKRRLADRKRTLARAESIIRRTVRSKNI